MMTRVILTPTALRQFEQAMTYTAKNFGLVQMRTYGQLLKHDLNAIPLCHNMNRTQYGDVGISLNLHLQHIQNYYAVYRVLEDGVFVVVALLWEGRDIPAHLHDLARSTRAEIERIKDQINRGLL